MNPAPGGGFGGFNFGQTPSFAAPTAAPATTNAPLSFGLPQSTQATQAATGFGLGNVPASSASLSFGTTPMAGGLSFGAKPVAAPAPTASTFGASIAAPASTTSAPSLTFGSTATSTVPLSFGAPASTSVLSFGTQAPITTTSSLTFGAPTQASASIGQSTSTAAANVTLNTNTGPVPGFGLSTTTTQSAAAISNQLTFTQIEELINKYTSELEEQEKVFINQATQVNSWDNLLNRNSKKIVELSNAVEKVKSEQKCLEDELKFIETQHTELEEFIVPLKREVDKIPHSDVEKAQTYSLAENLDTQLRQMSEDLKEVIEHLNEVSKLQNSNDPVVQIGRILNAHMTSLQWIEMQTSNINSKLEDINKMYDTLRRDTERSLRLTYCD